MLLNMKYLNFDGISYFYEKIKSYINTEISPIPIEQIDNLFNKSKIYSIDITKPIQDNIDELYNLIVDIVKQDTEYNTEIKAQHIYTCNAKINGVVKKIKFYPYWEVWASFAWAYIDVCNIDGIEEYRLLYTVGEEWVDMDFDTLKSILKNNTQVGKI